MKLDKVRFKQAVKLGFRNDTDLFTSVDGLDINVDFTTGVVSVVDMKHEMRPAVLVPWAQVRQATQSPTTQAPIPQPRGPGRPRKEDPNG